MIAMEIILTVRSMIFDITIDLEWTPFDIYWHIYLFLEKNLCQIGTGKQRVNNLCWKLEIVFWHFVVWVVSVGRVFINIVIQSLYNDDIDRANICIIHTSISSNNRFNPELNKPLGNPVILNWLSYMFFIT